MTRIQQSSDDADQARFPFAEAVPQMNGKSVFFEFAEDEGEEETPASEEQQPLVVDEMLLGETLTVEETEDPAGADFERHAACPKCSQGAATSSGAAS